MARDNRRGRSKSGQPFVQLFHYMLKSPAWRSLTPAQRSIYIEVEALYNGSNNGRLALSARDGAERAGVNKDTACQAFGTLIDRGFVECATPGGFSRKTRHATEWRLTRARCDATGELPTKAFLKWVPRSLESGRSDLERGPSNPDIRSPESGHSTMADTLSVPNEGTVRPDFGGSSVRIEGTHIDLPMGGPCAAPSRPAFEGARPARS